MRYGTLSNSELVRFAEQDPRYRTDPMFTELVDRLEPCSSPPIPRSRGPVTGRQSGKRGP